jgi:hypothetical protein
MEKAKARDGYKQFQEQLAALRSAAADCHRCAQHLNDLLQGFDMGQLRTLDAGQRLLRLKVGALRDFLELLKQWEREFEQIDEQLAVSSQTQDK